MKIKFIGDVHGLFNQYKKILKESDCPTIQIGDMGVGFLKIDRFSDKLTFSANPPYDLMVAGNHRFISGNHDNPNVCKQHSQWIPNGTMETTDLGTKLMYVGGAWSIDQAYRIEGVSWWPDEELSMQEFYIITDNYVKFKPDVMITHDFPGNIAKSLFLDGTHKPVLKSRTGQAFEAMLNLHHPKIWVAGHWHISKDETINDTRFICLNELETLTLEL